MSILSRNKMAKVLLRITEIASSYHGESESLLPGLVATTWPAPRMRRHPVTKTHPQVSSSLPAFSLWKAPSPRAREAGPDLKSAPQASKLAGRVHSRSRVPEFHLPACRRLSLKPGEGRGGGAGTQGKAIASKTCGGPVRPGLQHTRPGIPGGYTGHCQQCSRHAKKPLPLTRNPRKLLWCH